MTDSKIGKLQQKIAEAKSFEQELIQALNDGELGLDQIPETWVTSGMVVTSLLKDEKNFYKVPVTLKTREVLLMMAQVNTPLYREIESSKMLPIELLAWVTSNLSTPILSHFPEQIRSKEFCYRAIKVSPKNAAHFPEHITTDRKFIEGVVEADPSTLKYLKKDIVDEALCEIAFKSQGFDLEHVPLELRSEDLCLRAFDENYTAIFAFPASLLNENLVVKAIKKAKPQELEAIDGITPEQFKTATYWLEMALKDSHILRLVPENFIDEHFVFKVAPSISKAAHLKYIPAKILTNPTISSSLIESNPMLLEGIPKEARDYLLCLAAVEKNGMALQFVPNKMQDPKIYNTAINQNAIALKYVPFPYIDESLPRIAVAKNGEAIEYVHESNIDVDLCKIALQSNAKALYFLPDRYRNNYDLNLYAIQQDGSDLSIVNERYRSLEICRIAFRASYKNWKHIPYTLRNDVELISLYNDYRKQGFMKE